VGAAALAGRIAVGGWLGPSCSVGAAPKRIVLPEVVDGAVACWCVW
jgi:hypothetical protein